MGSASFSIDKTLSGSRLLYYQDSKITLGEDVTIYYRDSKITVGEDVTNS